jgi:hypothetical protein
VDGAVMLALPEVALLPLQEPLALHAVAPVLDQVRVKLPPGATEVGVALTVTVGAAAPPLEELLPEEPEVPPELLELLLEVVPDEPELPELEEAVPDEPELLLEELEDELLLDTPPLLPEELPLSEEPSLESQPAKATAATIIMASQGAREPKVPEPERRDME